MADENQMIHGYAQDVQYSDLRDQQVFIDTDVYTGGGFNGFESKKLSKDTLETWLKTRLFQYVQAYTTYQQGAAGVNTPTAVVFGTIGYNTSYTVFTNYIMYTQSSGQHRVSASFQINRMSGGSAQVIDFWINVNGVAVLGSNKHVTVNSNNGVSNCQLEWIVSFGYGDILNVMWQTTDVAIVLAAQPASGSMPQASSASVIIQRV